MLAASRRRWLTLSLFLQASGLQAQEAKPVRFLPYVGPSIEAARYLPADEDFAWVGWIGAQVDIAEKGRWSLYFTPQMETILGHRVRSFEAVQANYSLEIGASRVHGRGRISPFFHHVSRHVQDRDKEQAVDWNFLGVKYNAPWPERWNRRGAWAGSFAVATLSSGVNYNWEARVGGDADLTPNSKRSAFVLADLRRIGASVSPGFPRGGFTDARLEVGLRRWTDTSQSALFLAYERRNDALIPEALVTNRALLGFRIRGHRRTSPDPPAP